jgi:Protein of unknown function (DUF3303)
VGRVPAQKKSLQRRFLVKYVITWSPRAGGSAEENEAAVKRSLEVYSKWSPRATVHQFVTRLDGQGGFAVLEADDPAVIARDSAIFTPYLEFGVYPVLDIDQAMGIIQEGIEFRASV